MEVIICLSGRGNIYGGGYVIGIVVVEVGEEWSIVFYIRIEN